MSAHVTALSLSSDKWLSQEKWKCVLQGGKYSIYLSLGLYIFRHGTTKDSDMSGRKHFLNLISSELIKIINNASFQNAPHTSL